MNLVFTDQRIDGNSSAGLDLHETVLLTGALEVLGMQSSQRPLEIWDKGVWGVYGKSFKRIFRVNEFFLWTQEKCLKG